MNSLTSIVMTDPDEKESVCAQFVIDDLADPFILSGVMTAEKEYTLSFWAKSETAARITIGDTTFDISTGWTKCTSTFAATDDDLLINFASAGTYYIYHLQLELGNTATDWAPAPEDAMSQIDVLKNQISMLVTDSNGISMMTQTANGWSFNMGAFSELLNATQGSLDSLIEEYGSTESALAALRERLDGITEWVNIGVYYLDGNENNTTPENMRPCIELGEGDTVFRLRITNTSVIFFDGPTSGTSIDKDGLTTNNVSVSGEIRQSNPNAEKGSGSFVWVMRQNGNYGLTWKGLSN